MRDSHSHRRSPTRLQHQILAISRRTVLCYHCLPAPFPIPCRLRHVEQVLSAMWLEQQGPVWRRKDVPPEFAAWAPAPVRAACADARVGTADPRLCHPRGAGAELVSTGEIA